MNTIENHYNKAVSEALSLIEKKALVILQKHRNIHEFTMGMGAAFFTNHIGAVMEVRSYMRPVFNILNEWDEYLKLTGEFMTLTANGRKQSRK
jgi:hypothetical protein